LGGETEGNLAIVWVLIKTEGIEKKNCCVAAKDLRCTELGWGKKVVERGRQKRFGGSHRELMPNLRPLGSGPKRARRGGKRDARKDHATSEISKNK